MHLHKEKNNKCYSTRINIIQEASSDAGLQNYTGKFSMPAPKFIQRRGLCPLQNYTEASTNSQRPEQNYRGKNEIAEASLNQPTAEVIETHGSCYTVYIYNTAGLYHPHTLRQRYTIHQQSIQANDRLYKVTAEGI